MQRVKNVRLFKSDLLERFTYIHPAVPFFFWTPIVTFLCFYSLTTQALSWTQFLLWGASGLLTWTFVEYWLHRTLFHWDAQGKFGKFIVYIFHGNHHEVPDDPYRLVMPPLPAVLFASFFYALFYLIIGQQGINAFFAFFLIGYLAYDYIHFYTHHYSPKANWAKYLRKYHMLHHHRDHDAKFGVSSPLWDYILRTVHSKH